MHATPVKLLVRAVFQFDWRVGVRVGVSFLFSLSLSLVYRLKSPNCARHLGRLFLLAAPFCGYVRTPQLSGKEELDVRQLDVGIRLCTFSVRVSGGFFSVRSTPFWRC